MVGRYISENYNGVALHPIDFIDTSTGQLVAEVMDPNVTTISPVNKLHPREDVLATGSSRFEYVFLFFCSIISLLYWCAHNVLLVQISLPLAAEREVRACRAKGRRKVR